MPCSSSGPVLFKTRWLFPCLYMVRHTSDDDPWSTHVFAWVEPPSQKMIQISTGSPFWSLWPLWESNSCEVGCWPCKHGRHGAWVASPRSNLVGVSPSEQKMAGLEDMTGVNPLLYLSYYEPCCSKESKKQQLGPTNTDKYVNIEYIWIHYSYENIGKQTSHGKRGTGIGYIASRSGNTPATNELLGPLKNFQ